MRKSNTTTLNKNTSHTKLLQKQNNVCFCWAKIIHDDDKMKKWNRSQKYYNGNLHLYDWSIISCVLVCSDEIRIASKVKITNKIEIQIIVGVYRSQLLKHVQTGCGWGWKMKKKNTIYPSWVWTHQTKKKSLFSVTLNAILLFYWIYYTWNGILKWLTNSFGWMFVKTIPGVISVRETNMTKQVILLVQSCIFYCIYISLFGWIPHLTTPCTPVITTQINCVTSA